VQKELESRTGESASFTSETNERMSLKFGTAGRGINTKTHFANLINTFLIRHTQTLNYTKLKSNQNDFLKNGSFPNKDCRLTRHGVVNFTPRTFHSWEKEPPVPNEYEKGWATVLAWALYKTEKCHAPAKNGTKIPRLSIP
jgi:hypothetical protein